MRPNQRQHGADILVPECTEDKRFRDAAPGRLVQCFQETFHSRWIVRSIKKDAWVRTLRPELKSTRPRHMGQTIANSLRVDFPAVVYQSVQPFKRQCDV